MSEKSVHKTVCERYVVRDGKSGWAVIMLDERGGMVSIQSDYGNYGYRWPYHGTKSFKLFLTQIDNHYLVRKLTMDMANREEFDSDATLKRFEKRAKEVILEKRREQSFSFIAEDDRNVPFGEWRSGPSFEKKAARQCWDE